MSNEETVTGAEQPPQAPESEFFEIDETDTYRSVGDVIISAETEDGRTIGLVLTREDLRRLAMEAW